MLERIEQTTSWLKKLDGDTRARVEVELEKQRRALEEFLDGKKPKRTAQRIIERSHTRVAKIVAGGQA